MNQIEKQWMETVSAIAHIEEVDMPDLPYQKFYKGGMKPVEVVASVIKAAKSRADKFGMLRKRLEKGVDTLVKRGMKVLKPLGVDELAYKDKFVEVIEKSPAQENVDFLVNVSLKLSAKQMREFLDMAVAKKWKTTADGKSRYKDVVYLFAPGTGKDASTVVLYGKTPVSGKGIVSVPSEIINFNDALDWTSFQNLTSSIPNKLKA